MSAFAGHGRAIPVDDDEFDADGSGNKSDITIIIK
jgi:hypothetical protein